MSVELLTLTETQINRAIQEQNLPLLQKESIFLLNNYALNMSDSFSEEINYVKPVNVRFKTEPEFLFKENYVSLLKKLLTYSEQMMNREIDVLEAKLFFDSWFYDVTKTGVLIINYNDSQLLNITEAAKFLNCTRQTVYKYIERGLEATGETNNQRIPLFLLKAWKDPTIAFRMQWNYQLKKAREESVQEQLNRINKRIQEFEMEYNNTYHRLYGHYSDHEIDALSDAVDIFDWKELEKEKEAILQRLAEVRV